MDFDKKKLIKNISISLLMGLALYCVLSTYDWMVRTEGNYHIAIRNTLDIGLFGILEIILISISAYICVYKSKWLFKYRFIIAAIVFIICVALGVNGSSIECMYNYFHTQMDSNIIAGVSRSIRSDEWAVLTPLTMSQYFGNKFSYFSDIVRATSTDVFIEYGTPVKSLIMIFRPFYIGYLFLPFANGLAFFWCGRAIALFMTSFEFGRLITRDNRKLSLVYAVMVILAPAVQWWFAINGFVEMLIYAQLSIILLKKYMNTKSYLIKTICAVVISICAGGYVLTMYPSWMVPLAYVILFLAIWVIVENYKECKMTLKDIPVIAVAIIIFAIGMIYVFSKSFDTIKTLMSTVYPGKRFETGGGNLEFMSCYVTNIWYSIFNTSPVHNVCECAGFICMYPMGIVLYISYIIKSKKRDCLATVLTILSVILSIWCFVGFPSFIAKLTLMSNSQAARTLVILQFVSLILLIRAIQLWNQYDFSLKNILIISLIIDYIVVGLAYNAYNDYYPISHTWLITFVVFEILIVALFTINKKYNIISLIYILIFMVVTSGLVNPIRLGSENMNELDELGEVSKIVEDNPDAIWAVEAGLPLTNSLIMVGARTINSVNVYPNLDKWKELDENGEYEDVYNRYAHITVNIVDEDFIGDVFETTFADSFRLNITVDQLKSLGIEYVFTMVEHNHDDLELLVHVNDTYVYAVK